MTTQVVKDDNFDNEIKSSKLPVLVDFGQNGVAHVRL